MEQVNKVIEALVEVIKSASQAVGAQLPDIAQQAVAWEIQSSWVWMIVCALIALVSVLVFLWGVADQGEGRAFGGFVAAIIFVSLAVGNYLDMKRAEVAPKVFLLEYFTKQIRELHPKK